MTFEDSQQTERVTHATLVFEREVPATVEKVFSAFDNAKLRAELAAPSETATIIYDQEDFQEGGEDRFRCGSKSNPSIHCTIRHLEIIPDRRIVSSETISRELRPETIVNWMASSTTLPESKRESCALGGAFGMHRKGGDFLYHCQQLVASGPNVEKWCILLDALNIHAAESLVRRVADMERIFDEALGMKGQAGILKSMKSRAKFLRKRSYWSVFEYKPKHCSWLNQVEVWFSILKLQVVAESWLLVNRERDRGYLEIHCPIQSRGKAIQVDF